MRGHIEARGDGVWRIRIDIGPDPITGRRRVTSKTIHGTRRQAEHACAELIAQRQAPTARRTVGQLIRAWYDHNAPNLSPSTATGYESKIRLYILPALDDLPLAKLTTERLDHLYRELSTRGGTRQRDGRTVRVPLAANTVLGVHRIIHAACEQARRWRWIDDNPAELATRPAVPDDEVTPPDADRLIHLLADVRDRDPDFADVVHLEIATGARRGALCAVRWTDIDLDAGQITLARAIVETGTGGQWEERGRNRTKRRRPITIALDDSTIAMLRARRARALERALACGVIMSTDAFVLSTDPQGVEPLRPQLVTSRWRRLAARHDIECRFHDLRHFVITYLLGAGVPVRDVAERHGHAGGGRMTLERYGHALPATDRRIADLLGELLDRGTG